MRCVAFFISLLVAAPACAQESARADPAGSVDRSASTDEPAPRSPEDASIEEAPPSEPAFYETWWFWTAIGAFVLGITLAVVVDVTTDDPSPRRTSMGLALRF